MDEATLTGETYPVEKSVGVLAAATPLGQRTNALWMGTHVVSGQALVVVVAVFWFEVPLRGSVALLLALWAGVAAGTWGANAGLYS